MRHVTGEVDQRDLGGTVGGVGGGSVHSGLSGDIVVNICGQWSLE